MALPDVEHQQLGTPLSHNWTPLLRELAALDAFPDQVVSLYLDVCRDDERQRERTRLQIKDQMRVLHARLGNGESDPSVERDLARVERYVEEAIHGRGEAEDRNLRGLALFLSAARGFERAIRSTFRFPNLLTAGPTPVLRPMVSSFTSRGRVLCIVCDSNSARLYELGADGSGPIASLDGTVPRRHHAGGWSQLKLQHRRIEEVAHLHKEAAQLVLRFFEESGGRARVLLGGRADAQASLESHLSGSVMKRLRRVSDVNAADSEAQTLASFARALSLAEGEEAAARVERVENMAGAAGRGALDIVPVVDAINAGRVSELLLAERFALDGWRCARCRVIGVGGASSCTACGGPTESLELGEALVHGAILQDAAVTILPSPSRLDLHAGIAAETRF